MAADAATKRRKGMEVEGYPVEGLSIGGQETCVIFPGLKMAFDIGRCPQRAISQDYLFISHGHMDHIVYPCSLPHDLLLLSAVDQVEVWIWSLIAVILSSFLLFCGGGGRVGSQCTLPRGGCTR